MLITNTITMAIDRQQMPPVIDAVQGEANSRAIKIQLTNGGQPWSVPSDVSCFVRFGKPDKTGGIYDTLEDGTSAVEIGENYLQFLLVEQVVSFPGDVFVQVEMTKNGASLSTFSVVVRVQEDKSIGALESKDYYNLRKYVYEEIKNFFDDDTPTTAMTVTFSGNANSGYKADKTFAEIGNALSAGTTVIGVLRSAALNIVLDNVLMESEQGYCSFNGQVRRYAGGEAIPIESWTAILHSGDTVEVFSEDIATAETMQFYLPVKLPNPNALTINGQTYDGSEAVTVDTTPLVITVTGDDKTGYTADRTCSELNAAFSEGRQIVCKWGTYPTISLSGVYTTLQGFQREYSFVFIKGASMVGFTLRCTISTESVIVVRHDDNLTRYPLIINNNTYDGSKQVIVNTSDVIVDIAYDDATQVFSAPYTFAYISAALAEGRSVYCRYAEMLIPLLGVSDGVAQFSATIAAGDSFFTYVIGIDSDNAVSVNEYVTETREFVFTVTGTDADGYTSDVSYEEVRAAYDAGRTVVCVINSDQVMGFRTPLAMVDDSSMAFIAAPGAGLYVMVQFTAEGVFVGVMLASVKIGDQQWDMDQYVDFTDTINGMIDAKLAAITNAEEVAF